MQLLPCPVSITDLATFCVRHGQDRRLAANPKCCALHYIHLMETRIQTTRVLKNYRVTNSVDSVFDSRVLKKRALAIAMQTNTAPNVQTMVAPVGKSK